MMGRRSTEERRQKSGEIRCAAIGEGSILLSCLKILQTANFKITAVFTDTLSVKSFCDDANIKNWGRRNELSDILKTSRIDYLFSISNPRILKEDVLRIAKRLTINYHDSPLPAYAGIHATSWAIINGETKHGISWHVVESGIDTGDILQQQHVLIDEHDSALTLNLKCQETAIDAFEKLVEDIKADRVFRLPQSKEGRSYYGLNAIPPNIGVLSFQQNTKTLYNLARALEFGNHENSLGCAKLLTSTGDFVLVTNAQFTPRKYYEKSEAGTILDIVDDAVVVSTSEQPLLLSVANLDGSIMQPYHFRTLGLVTGFKFRTLSNVESSDLYVVRKKETFWKKKLEAYEPTVFFRQRMNVVAGIIDVSEEIHLEKKTIELPKIDESNDFIKSALVLFIARICCLPTVHIGLVANKSVLPEAAQKLYSDICPAILSFDLQKNVREIIDICQQGLTHYEDSLTYPIDMFYRYPDLRGRKQTPHHNLVLGTCHNPSAVEEVGKSVLHNCNIGLMYVPVEQALHIMYKKRPGQDFGFLVDIFKHVPTFLSSVNQKRDMKLGNVQLVPNEEINLLYQSPSPVFGHQKLKSIVELFSNTCKEHSEKCAMKTTTGHLTYQDTRTLVDQISEILKKTANNGRKRVIGLHLPNSIAYVVSLLAVLKCNQVFLPLPLNYPHERLVFTMTDSKVQTVITTKNALKTANFEDLKLPLKVVQAGSIDGLEIVLVQFELDENEKMNRKNWLLKKTAYIMYTSGSTGKPKGVKVTETSVINLARAQIRLWGLTSDDVIGQFASIGFDATISEIFTSLFSGATLAIYSEKDRLGQEFVETTNHFNISTITLPPSLLNIYSPKDLPTLKKVVTAGEACTLSVAVKWAEKDKRRFFNAYGPTETTVCATCFEFNPENEHEDVNRELSIGKAIPGAYVYLYDDFMKPIPPDVIGEIYIGGIGVSEGYHGHASHMTKEKFIQHPLDERCILYKTGDHGFQDSDGNITFVGRLDDMVKIRGQRVDLSEIEQVLIQHPKVEVAIVVPHRCSKSNELSIAAFVAPTFVFASELREYLAKVLPKYMTPTFIKKFDIAEFPKTINGKIDKKKLEKDESVHEQLQVVGHSHLNEIQLMIAKLWCLILKLESSNAYSFHRQSSFSEMGGNSLQLVLLQRHLESKFGIQLSFTDIGAADTIEEFGDVVKRKRDVCKKNEQSRSHDQTELRTMILEDSEITRDLFMLHARRVSVDIPYISATNLKSNLRYPKNVLISGVTGFLGAYLLSELLQKSNAHICCMVRESSEARGIGRIVENMRRYDLWKFEYTTRIAVVISDLSQPRLGIAPDIYNSLCNSVDAIYMNAAMMNFNTSYEDHRVANVKSTKEFITFALTGVQKFIFATSSLGVFLFPPTPNLKEPQNKIMYECDEFDDPCQIAGGYGQSKWASERLVIQALDLLPGGAVFRPARITGSTTSGRAPTNDLFASTLYGMKKIGCFPDMDFPYDLTPVDYTARAMVEISLRICNDRVSEHERVYHLFNKQTMPFKDLFEGMSLKPLPLEEWRKVLRAAPEDNKELIPLTPFFMSTFWDRSPYWPVFDTSNTDNLISKETKELLRPSRELLKLYKKHFDV